jgi:phage pi2 protein 07
MKTLQSISQYILFTSLIVNIILIYEIYTLPTKISNELHKDCKTDTIVKNIVKTAQIETKGNLIYINGNIISSPIKISDNYKFSPNNPNEFYDGYFYEIQTINGGKYYIWKQTDEFKTNTHIDGWFMSINNGKYENDKKEQFDIIIPVMKRNQTSMLK